MKSSTRHKILAVTAITSTFLFQSNAKISYAESNNTRTVTQDTEYDDYSQLAAGVSQSGEDANNNTLNIEDGNIETEMIVGGTSAESTGTANNNIVNIKGGNIEGLLRSSLRKNVSIFGGYSNVESSYNTVNINSGAKFSADDITIYGGIAAPIFSSAGTATGNIVNLNGVKISGAMIVGGMANDTASNNTINLTDSTVAGYIYGGIAKNVVNNVVNIYGKTDLSDANIFGGYWTEDFNSSGNALNIYTKNITAKNVVGFNNLNFYLPSDISNGDTVLTLTDAEGTDFSGVEIKAGVQGGANLNEGDKIILAKNSAGIKTDNATVYGTLTEGVSLDYDITVAAENSTNITATIKKQKTTSTNDATKIIPASQFVGLKNAEFMTEQITDWLPPQTLKKNVAISHEIFSSIGYSSLKTKLGGSYIKNKVTGIDIGFATTLKNSAGHFTFAPVVEYARGNYDSFIDSGTSANGAAKYFAGGIILRQANNNGFYYEGSIRGGRVRTDFYSDNLDKTGNFGRVSYKTSSPLITGHLKVGKIFTLDEKNLLDVYAIYSLTRQGKTETNLSSGEHYKISSAKSSITRLGFKYSFGNIYAGLAYQYNYNSSVNGVYNEIKTPAVGESGHSGRVEFGWKSELGKNNLWSVDIKAVGQFGHQKGFNSVVKLQKIF